MTPDRELLRQYVQEGSETAFSETVRRHLNLVYGSAIRLLNNHAHLAEDVTQRVFTDLARKAGTLLQHESVAGWLYTSTRFAAANAIRTDQRRRIREHEAHAMSDHSPNYETTWLQLRPLIDEALSQLSETEREAVLLRFFEERSHREVGAALGLTEGAAQMRVDRAMNKMRAFFVRHGVTTTVALLTTTLGAQAARTSAPAILAANIAGKSLAGAATAGSGSGAWLQKFIRAKKSSLLAGTAALAATGVLAATYISLSPTRTSTTKATAQAMPFIPQKTISTPAPNMNPPTILTAAVLSAALISTPASTVVAADQSAPVSQQSTASASQQSNANPSSSNTSGKVNQDAATSAFNAQPSNDIQAPVTPAPPGMGIATWDPQFIIPEKNGRPKVVDVLVKGIIADRPPYLVDMTGVLKGKTVTAINGRGELKPYFNVKEVHGRQTALCSDGMVAIWGPGLHPSLTGEKDHDNSLYQPVLVDTSSLKEKKIVTVESRAGGDYILCSDGTIYSIRDYNYKGADFTTAIGILKKDLGTRITKFSGSDGNFIALRQNGTLIAAGFNGKGELGVGQKIDSAGQQVGLTSVYTGGVLQGKKVIDLATEGSQSLALCSDGTLAYWGTEVVPGMYELGLQADHVNASVDIDKDKQNLPGLFNIFDGTMIFNFSGIPVRVLDETGLLKGKTITALAHASGSILVLCSDGTVAAWGGEVAPLTADMETNPYEANGPPFYYYIDRPLDLPATAYPILVSGTGALAGKTVTAITDEGLMLCSDNTLVQWNGDSAPVAVNLGAIKGRTIIAIAPRMALFK